MITFKIFKKSKSFYWSINKIYYCTLFSFLGVGFIFEKIHKPISLIFLYPAVIVMLSGIYFKLKNLIEIEPVRGILNGDLIFEKDSIIIDNKTYSLDEIHKIEISNDDFRGKLIHTSKGQIGPALSNGTNNFLIIFLKSKETKKIQFELIESNDFQKLKTTLIEYYIKGKMNFKELVYVLGEKSRSDLKELHLEISKIKKQNETQLSNSAS